MYLAVSDGVALLFLFVVLPVILGLAITALVQWRSAPVPTEHLTSELLRNGTATEATLIDWSAPGVSFVDLRPMVTFRVALPDRDPAEMLITQSVPRGALRSIREGMKVTVLLSADGTAGAIAFSEEPG